MGIAGLCGLTKQQATFSDPQSCRQRNQTCCRVAICSSMAIAPLAPALPGKASSSICVDLQQQMASSAAALAPVQQVVSDAFAAAAAVISQRDRSANDKVAKPVLQQAVLAAAAAAANSNARVNTSSSSRTASSTKALRQLTTTITQCTSWRELQFLYTAAGPRMNIIHISACLSTLGKQLRACPAEPWELHDLQTFMQQLECGSTQLLSIVQMPQAGMLQVYRTGNFMQDSTSSSCNQAQAVPALPQQLSTMAWGWAAAGFVPGRSWWTCYWAASTLQLAAYRPQELATALWAAAKLQQHPPAAWMAGFWLASTAAVKHARPQEICMILWGVAELNLQPSSSWWRAVQAAVASKQGQMTARDLSQVFWAHARLHTQPPSLWSQQLLQRCQGIVQRFSPRDTAMLLWSCAVLQLQPGQQLLESMVQCLMINNCNLQVCNAQDFAHILWALAVLKHQLETCDGGDVRQDCATWQPDQPTLCSSSGGNMLSSSSNMLSSSSNMLSTSSNRPSSPYVSTPMYNSLDIVDARCSVGTNPSSSNSSSSSSSSSRATVGSSNGNGARVSAHGSSGGIISGRLLQSWTSLTWRLVEPSVACTNPTDAAQLLWAAVHLPPSCWPSRAWLSQYWRVSEGQLACSALQHVASHSSSHLGEGALQATVIQGTHPIRGTHPQFEDASAAGCAAACQSAMSPAYSAQAITLSMWAGLKMGAPPPMSWLMVVLPPLQQHLAELQPAAACQLLYVLARLQYRPNPEFMQQLLSRLQLDAHLLQPRAFACILWGLGRLGFQPGSNWWDVIFHHLGVHVPGLEHRELQHVLYGLVALQPTVPKGLQQALQERATLLQSAQNRHKQY